MGPMRKISVLLFVLLCGFAPAFASAAAVRSLSVGMSGADVKALQQALVDKGYLSTSATGTFGPATLAAVKKFQCASGIICKGVAFGTVGPATRAALGLAGAGSAAFEVSGWLPYWREATGTADVSAHIKQLTSVMPFGYVVQNDGGLSDAFKLEADTPTSPTASALLSLARGNGVKVVPTIMWSNGSAIASILSDPTSRQTLEDSIAAVATRNNFDGVDIDFENKPAETKDDFSLFLQGLKQRLGTRLLYCAIEARTPVADRYDGTPPPDATEYANDFTAIGTYCDRVELMTYDQQTEDVALDKTATEAAGPYIPVSDPAWVAKVVNLTAQSIPKSKIVIGIPTYGYEWKVTPMQLSGFRFDLQWAFNPRYAEALARSLGTTPSRNQADELSFIYNPQAAASVAAVAAASNGNVSSSSGTGLGSATAAYTNGATVPASDGTYDIVWWSDAKAIADKVALAKKLGVRGVALFKLDGGEDPNMWNALPGSLASR